MKCHIFQSLKVLLMAAIAFGCGWGGVWADGVEECAKLVTFSTIGPDRYADGSVVLDGESYALVWQSSQLDAVRFTAQGAIADGADARVLRILPLAEGGRCPKTVFAVDESSLPALRSAGRLRLYLLDTRTFGADGVAKVNGSERVQGSVPVTASVSVAYDDVVGAEAALNFATSVLGVDAKQPKVTAIKVLADVIELTVESTLDSVNYNAADADGKPVAAHPVTGGANTITITIPRDKSRSCGLFRVVRDGGGR